MNEWSIPVDLRNPGQVFACRGIVEGAEILLSRGFASRFEYRQRATNARFIIASTVDVGNPISVVLEFLRRARASLAVPSPDSTPRLSGEKWQVASESAFDDHVYPMRVPQKPASLPVVLTDGTFTLHLDSWSDGPNQLGRDNVKFWAGAGGYPGAALARDSLAAIARSLETEIAVAVADPFAVSAPMTSSFRFDWRRDYIPLDAGFSPNDHGDMKMLGYPLTEMLAAIGLQHARPQRVDARDKLRYRYGISPEMLPTILARPILGAIDVGFPMRTFHVQLGWPGKENQARCIIDAREEVN